jgi:hypothetical protein
MNLYNASINYLIFYIQIIEFLLNLNKSSLVLVNILPQKV